MNDLDIINHPTHYTCRKHECIDEMIAVFGVADAIVFCKLNAWKYRYRAGAKGTYEEDMAKILEAIPSITTDTVPASAYDGIDHDTYCMSTFQGIQCSTDFSQEDGYRFFKAMWEDGKSIWQTAYPNGAKNNVPEMTLSTAKTPLQAGTVQYLNELGYEVPAELIPPEYVEV